MTELSESLDVRLSSAENWKNLSRSRRSSVCLVTALFANFCVFVTYLLNFSGLDYLGAFTLFVGQRGGHLACMKTVHYVHKAGLEVRRYALV